MNLNRVWQFIFLTLMCAATSFAQVERKEVNADPVKARFIYSDIDNFWRAFDLASKETDKAKRIAIYQAEYLDKGSAGLQDFLQMRIGSAQTLVETVDTRPRFYASVRPGTAESISLFNALSSS